MKLGIIDFTYIWQGGIFEEENWCFNMLALESHFPKLFLSCLKSFKQGEKSNQNNFLINFHRKNIYYIEIFMSNIQLKLNFHKVYFVNILLAHQMN